MAGKLKRLDYRMLWPCSLALGLLLLVAAMPLTAEARSPVTGHWVGTTKVRCGSRLSSPERCNATQNVTFDLIENGAKITGSYTCAYGTQDCLGMNTKGKVTEGSFDGHVLLMAVNMGTGSTCRFKGGLKENTGQGSYACKGVSAAEQGTWRLHRVSAEAPPAAPQIPSLIRGSKTPPS